LVSLRPTISRLHLTQTYSMTQH